MQCKSINISTIELTRIEELDANRRFFFLPHGFAKGDSLSMPFAFKVDLQPELNLYSY